MIIDRYGREVREADEPVRDPEQVADALTGTLARGLTWLYDVEQPPETIPPSSHHGPTLFVPLVGRSVGFAPVAADGLPVVVVESTEYTSTGGTPLHGIAPGEIEAVCAVISGVFGRAVRRTWNGAPYTSGSIQLIEPAHPSLRAAVEYYIRGCPEHRTVFCSSAIDRRHVPGPACSWNDVGRARAVAP